MLPRPGGWLSRCCAYQGSFRKSSKSVVNSVVHIRESAYFSRLCRDNQGCSGEHLNRRGRMFPVFHGKPKLPHAVPCVSSLMGRDHSAGQQRIFAERDIKLPHSPTYHQAVLPDRTWKTFLFQRKCGERHSPFPARLKTQFAAETEVMWGLTPSYQ